MAEQMEKIVKGLPALESVTGVWAEVDGRVAQGDAAFAADLGIALAGTYGTGGELWQYRSVFDHLLRLLATTAGAENVVQALRLVSSPEAADRKQDRYTASLLASSQAAADLASAFTGRASEELRACLVHELVLRGVAVAEVPGVADWATSPHWRHHPLGRLPLTRSALEEGADLPSYSVRGSGHSMPYGSSEGHVLPLKADAQVPAAEETTTPVTAAAMGAAVDNWVEESNGRIEARVFDLADPLDTGAVPGALLALGLESLDGAGKKGKVLSVDIPWAGKRRKVSVESRSPSLAWRVLFAAASTGGAYNSGAYGAYGRLAAWQSLAALAGSPEGADAAEVEARVLDCLWFGFDADTKWFERVAWDIGLAALSPDRRRLAVLAATDTD